MPTYEYLCEGCGHHLEEFQLMNEDPLTKCPECGKKKLQRVISGGAAIIFKGSGFYETDYRSDSYQAGAKADKDATSSTKETNGTESGSSGESESKTSGKSSKSSESKSDD